MKASSLPLALCALLLVSVHSASAALGDLVTTFNLHAARMIADPVRPRIYATLDGSNAVAVIDTSTMKLVQVIPIGSNPLGLSISPDGNTLYVANNGSTVNGVGVIDLNTLQALPSLPTPYQPSDIAAGLNGQLYLVVGPIAQLSTSGTVPAIYFGDDDDTTAFLAMSPDRQTLYYGDTGDSIPELESFDVSGTSGTLLQKATSNSFGGGGQDLKVSHSGAFLSFPNPGQGSSQIFEIPTDNLSAINGSFDAGYFSVNIAFSPDDALAYTAPEFQYEMEVFDTSTYLETGTFALPGNTDRITTDSSGKYLFAAGQDEDYNPTKLYVYETGRAAAVITSATSATAALGAGLSYQITASNSPTSFNATGLPAGLSVNPSTGLISGTAAAVGTSNVIISASNAIGIAMADLAININGGGSQSLTVSINGHGYVTNGFLGTTLYAAGSAISITATPVEGYLFTGWTGSIASGSNPLTFTLGNPTTIQANFTKAVSSSFGNLVATFNLAASRMAVDPIRPRIYATLTGSNAVAVIDTSTMQLVQVIPVGSSPLGLAISADGNTLYVANGGSTINGVSVINLNTLQALPSLSTPEAPGEIAVGLNGRLYLTIASADTGLVPIMQISASGTTPAANFGQYDNEGVAYLAMSPDRKTLYFGDTGLSPATLTSFDVSTGTATLLQSNDTTVGGNGEDLEVSRSGAFVCFPNGGGQGQYQTWEIPANNFSAVIGAFDVGPYPTNIAFSPDDAVAYTAPGNQNQMQTYDTSNCEETGTFAVSAEIVRLATDTSGKYLFAAGLNTDEESNPNIYVYDTGRPAAVITSSTSAATTTGASFTYQITATNSPTSFNATGLPAGFAMDPSTGLISGSTAATGTSAVVISASNAIGVAMADLQIAVTAGVPTESLTVTVNGPGSVSNGFLGTTSQYAGSQVSITAVPDTGCVFTGWTGDITSGSNPLGFTINSPTSIQANFVSLPPTISDTTQAAQYGNAFAYQISTSGAGPFAYAATGLPSGLSVDPDTGVISGTPADAGQFSVNLSAVNTSGTGTGTLMLDVASRLTVIASQGGLTNSTGVTYPELDSTVTLTATPLSGYFFADWSGNYTSSSNSLIFSMPVSAVVTANFLPWSDFAGTYSGLLSSGSPNGSGTINFEIDGLGDFLATVDIDGTKYPLFLTLSGSNSVGFAIPRGNLPAVTGTLALSLSGTTPQVTGTLADGVWTSDLSANQYLGYSKFNPSPLAGLYTVALLSSTQTQGIPAGTGYATMSVNTAGLARLTGALADGTPFSASAAVEANGALPLYLRLYNKQGALLGTITFESLTSTGELEGTFNWFKPATKSKTFPAAFSTSLDVAGSSYTLSQALGTSGTLSFQDGNVSAPFSQSFTITPPHKITITDPNAHSVSFSVDEKNGSFSGKFVDQRKMRHFRGVILQQQSAGAGVFVDGIGSGSVSLTISP